MLVENNNQLIAKMYQFKSLKSLLILLCFIVSGQVNSQAIKINEFMASNNSSIQDESGSFADWVELYNPGPVSVNIAGMYLSDDLLEPLKHQMAYGNDSTIIPAGGYLILWADNDLDEGILHLGFQLSAGGEAIAIYSNAGNLIDQIVFEEQTTDVSYGRLGDGNTNWVFYGVPSPGASNSIHYLAPSLTNIVFASQGSYSNNLQIVSNVSWTIAHSITWISISDSNGSNDGVTTITTLNSNPNSSPREGIITLNSNETGPINIRVQQLGSFDIPSIVINELMASNSITVADEYGEYDDWIELYNKGIVPIDIGGYYLTDDLSDPLKFLIPDSNPALTTIQPGSFLLIWADGETEQGILHTSFKLSSSGEDVGLYIDQFTPVDIMSFPAQTIDISYGRTSDGVNNWTFFDSPTPGASNNSNNHSESSSIYLSIYPNPSSSRFILETPMFDYQLNVYSSLGKLVYQEQVFSNYHQIELGAMPTGIYFVELIHAESRLTQKIILKAL